MCNSFPLLQARNKLAEDCVPRFYKVQVEAMYQLGSIHRIHLQSTATYCNYIAMEREISLGVASIDWTAFKLCQGCQSHAMLNASTLCCAMGSSKPLDLDFDDPVPVFDGPPDSGRGT